MQHVRQTKWGGEVVGWGFYLRGEVCQPDATDQTQPLTQSLGLVEGQHGLPHLAAVADWNVRHEFHPSGHNGVTLASGNQANGLIKKEKMNTEETKANMRVEKGHNEKPQHLVEATMNWEPRWYPKNEPGQAVLSWPYLWSSPDWRICRPWWRCEPGSCRRILRPKLPGITGGREWRHHVTTAINSQDDQNSVSMEWAGTKICLTTAGRLWQ